MDDAHHVEPDVQPEPTTRIIRALLGEVAGREPPRPAQRLALPTASAGHPNAVEDLVLPPQNTSTSRVARDDVHLALRCSASYEQERVSPAPMQMMCSELLARTDRIASFGCMTELGWMGLCAGRVRENCG